MTNAIHPADRVSTVTEYYLQRKMQQVAELDAQGLDIVSLGIGGPDTPPPAHVIETLCQSALQADAHGYQPGNGLPAMRQAMARWYHRRYGIELNADTQIMPLIGSKEGILHISLTFLNPGDGVLVPNPGYPTYTSVSRLVGAKIHTYDLVAERHWQPDIDALERADLAGVKLMWVNFPNMPTGARASRQLFDRLIDFGRRHDILIVNDNPYSFILNDNPLSILGSDGAFDVALEMNSLSKSHSMAGWRVGMLAGKAEYLTWVRRVKSNVDSGQFKPVMLAATEALDVDDTWYHDLNTLYARRRDVAEDIARALGCTFDQEQRGLFLWCRIPDSEPSGEVLADRVLDLARVFITPGFIFGSNGDRYIRISLCATPQRMQTALERIRRMSSSPSNSKSK